MELSLSVGEVHVKIGDGKLWHVPTSDIDLECFQKLENERQKQELYLERKTVALKLNVNFRLK